MFDIEQAEAERSKALGTENPVWQRYLRIRDVVLAMGPVLGMTAADRDGWRTFVFIAEAFPPDPEPADQKLESEAKSALNAFLEKSGTLLLDAHEAVLLYDQLITQEQLNPAEALERIGKLPEFPLEAEILAALLSVIPQEEPDLSTTDLGDLDA